MINKLFSYTKPIASYGLLDVVDWFVNHPEHNFNFIVDSESDYYSISLQERMEYYEGVNIIGIVMNPWARMKYCFDGLNLKKIKGIPSAADGILNTESFEGFILTYPANTKLSDSHWCNFGTNQIEWLTYIDQEGNKKEVNFLLRAETLETDFDKIKIFLDNDKSPFVPTSIYPEYKSQYSQQMKTKVEEIFHQDIEYFKYIF